MTVLALKRVVFDTLIAEGHIVNVRFTTGTPGVLLPPFLAGPPLLSLSYGHAMPRPMLAFLVDDQGIKATLHFAGANLGSDGQHGETVVPWDAVQAMMAANGTFACAWPPPGAVVAGVGGATN